MTKKTGSENTILTPNVVGVPSGRWVISLLAEIPRLTVVTTSNQANRGYSAHLDAWSSASHRGCPVTQRVLGRDPQTYCGDDLQSGQQGL